VISAITTTVFEYPPRIHETEIPTRDRPRRQYSKTPVLEAAKIAAQQARILAGMQAQNHIT
jgi:hypothetical protein